MAQAKVGPREAQLRVMRERRYEERQALSTELPKASPKSARIAKAKELSNAASVSNKRQSNRAASKSNCAAPKFDMPRKKPETGENSPHSMAPPKKTGRASKSRTEGRKKTSGRAKGERNAASADVRATDAD